MEVLAHADVTNTVAVEITSTNSQIKAMLSVNPLTAIICSMLITKILKLSKITYGLKDEDI